MPDPSSGRLARAFVGMSINPSVANFNMRQMGMLMLLDSSGRLEVKDIARAVQCSKPVVTRAASTFEAAGLARRVKHDNDLRRCSIELTARGHETAQQLVRTMGVACG